jgi:hypothetical protein
MACSKNRDEHELFYAPVFNAGQQVQIASESSKHGEGRWLEACFFRARGLYASKRSHREKCDRVEFVPLVSREAQNSMNAPCISDLPGKKRQEMSVIATFASDQTPMNIFMECIALDGKIEAEMEPKDSIYTFKSLFFCAKSVTFVRLPGNEPAYISASFLFHHWFMIAKPSSRREGQRTTY